MNWKTKLYEWVREINLYEVCLGVVLISMSLFFLSIAYTVILNGGLEYTVRIGR